MKLIVDSGSTKTDWAVISDADVSLFETQGINPSSEKSIFDLSSTTPQLTNLNNSISEIYYYGAGVINERSAKIIHDWLCIHFDFAKVIKITSDMIGACKATANNKKGIISILGTGSNSCKYNGQEITDNIPALGYSLSNEGGGTEIGKAVLQSYFYRKMPENVKQEFEKIHQIDKSTVVNAMYKQENPTAFVANFASFINKTEDKVWRKSILTEQFQKFIDIRIKSYSEYSSYQLHFVGSIAYFCQDVLKEILQYNNLEATSIIRKPIDGLIAFHQEKI